MTEDRAALSREQLDRIADMRRSLLSMDERCAMLRQAHSEYQRMAGEPPRILWTNDVGIAAALAEALPGNNIGIIIDYALPDGEFYFTDYDGEPNTS